MKITDGSNREIGIYCGQQTGRSVLVSDTVAVLTFKTDRSVHSSGFQLSFLFFPRGKLGCAFKVIAVLWSWDADACALGSPFCVIAPYLVDSLINAWINGMLMQMLDAELILLRNKFQAYYVNHLHVIPFLQL